MLGSKLPECTAPPGVVQVPPGSGVPPSNGNSANGTALAQMVIDPFVPGSIPLSTVIVTQSVAGQAGCEGCIAVTQYSVVLVTVALGLAMFGFDSPPMGLQV